MSVSASLVIPHAHAHFTNTFGMTPEAVMQHGAVNIDDSTLVPIHEFQTVHLPEWESEGGHGELARGMKLLDKAHSDWNDANSMSHEALVKIALNNHADHPNNIGGPYGVLLNGYANGNYHKHAASLIALAHALRGESRPNDIPLYRGMLGDRTPNQDLLGKSRVTPGLMTGLMTPRNYVVPRNVVGFTEREDVAKHFSAISQTPWTPGAVYKLEPQEGRGLRLPDYGVNPGSKTGPGEREWLIHNISRQFVPVVAPSTLTSETPR
ncbi:MAG: hypothetical protein EBY26_00230 [Microbacteriaceae bacterium]|nr:hypothetical protein [Microbacteriaceae bacterium]